MTDITLIRMESLNADDNGQIYPVDQEMFWENITSYVRKKYILEDGIQNACSLIFGQCSK